MAKNSPPPSCVTASEALLVLASACVSAAVASLASSGVGASTTTKIRLKRLKRLLEGELALAASQMS